MVPPSLNWMVGKQVADIRVVEPVSWWFKFNGGGAMRVETLWRIVDAGGVRVTSQDHGQRFSLAQPVDAAAQGSATLANRIVQDARISVGTGDVIVDFENGSTLEILTTSTAFEGWSIVFPNGDEATGLGGGRVAFRSN